VKSFVKKQSINNADPTAMEGIEWLEAYDMLQRHWPHSGGWRSTSNYPLLDGRQPRLIEAAWRFVRRRRFQPPPARATFKSTVDYYDAIMPLLLARRRLEEASSSWRYVRPMMIRVMFLRWPHYKMH
jgi:hypothetical protein